MARQNILPIRLNNDEKVVLEILAKRQSFTLGEMIRQLIRDEATKLDLWPPKQEHK